MSIITQQTIQLKKVSQGNFLMRNVLKHNMVFAEGSRGKEAYILTEGKIEISGNMAGHKKVFAMLNPVSIFGEMALFLDDGARSATAVALEDSKVIVVTRDDMDEFLAKSPQVISSILTVLVNRLKSTTSKAMKVPSIWLGIVRILDLFSTCGKCELKHDATIKTLADTFMTTTEKIEAYLNGLVEQRLLALGRNRDNVRIIRILEPDLLNAVTRNKE